MFSSFSPALLEMFVDSLWETMVMVGISGVVLTRMDKVTVSRAAATLADRGLISRVASESDGRSHHLTLTKEGWVLYNDIAPAALDLEKSIIACLNADELRAFVDIVCPIEAIRGDAEFVSMDIGPRYTCMQRLKIF